MGEVLSLFSAFFWSCAVIIFKQIGDKVSPIIINTFKNLLNVFLIFLTIILLGQNPFTIPDIFTKNDIIVLIISGMIGLGIADILFLKSLNIVGAGISALVDIMYSPFVLFFAFILLGEKLLFLQIIGGILIFGSIIFASMKMQNIPVDRNQLLKGILIGVSALAMMAFCIVWIKPILDKTSETSNHLWIAGFRMIPGVITPLIISIFYFSKNDIKNIFKDTFIIKPLVVGAVFATYLGISFWIVGMAHTKASVAAILNQTASFFILILARIFLKELITPRKTLAIGVASFGAVLILIGGK